jgi:hypothetical protein
MRWVRLAACMGEMPGDRERGRYRGDAEARNFRKPKEKRQLGR